MITIATLPNNIGRDRYLPADLIDLEDCYKQGTLTERTVELMKRQFSLAEATPEVFAMAAARRPAGAPWPPRGFTEAYLQEKGFARPESEPAPEPAKAAKAEKKKPANVGAEITHVTLTSEKIPVGKFFVQPKKIGHFSWFDVVDAEGALMRPKSFKKVELATAFLEALSTGEPPAASPGGQETRDDHVVRREPDDSQG